VFEDLFSQLHEAIAAQQLIVLGWIAADPARSIDAFERAGGDRSLFLEPFGTGEDFEAIYVGIALAGENGGGNGGENAGDQLYAARLARAALKQRGCWSDADDWGGGGQWTNLRLARLFEAALRSPPIVERETKKLVALCTRLRGAYDHIARAHALLDETVDDVAERSGRREVAAAHRITPRAFNVQKIIEEAAPRKIGVAVRILRKKGNGVWRTKTITK
jgi:hypothetical protein